MTEDKSKYLIISNPIRHKRFGRWFFALIILLLIGGCFFISGLAHKPFVDLTKAIIGFTFLIAFVIVLKDVLRFKKVKISQTQILIKSIAGKELVIERKEIQSFYELNYEVQKKSGVDIWDELYLFTSRDLIKLSSKIQPEYTQLKGYLTNGISEYKNETIYDRYEAIKTTLTKATLFSLLGILCIAFFSIMLFYKEYIKSDITYDQLKELKGIIGDFPEIILTGRYRKKETGIKIELQEYPYYKFNFYKEDFIDSAYEDFRNTLAKGKPISIYISLDEYRKKVSKELPIKFNDKYFNFNNLVVLGVKYNGIAGRTGYTSPIDAAPERIEMYYLKLVILVLFIVGAIMSIYHGVRFWKRYKSLIRDREI